MAKRLARAICAVLSVVIFSVTVPYAHSQLVFSSAHIFGFRDRMGIRPQSALVKGSDGFFYGTTKLTGFTASSPDGVVFKIAPDGSQYVTNHSFNSTREFAANPCTGLIEASDGVLYGTTITGSSIYTNGTVFKVNKDGTAFAVLHQFANIGEGQEPITGVMEGADGRLYGTTLYGGIGSSSPGFGTIFSLQKDGSDFKVLHVFSRTNSDGGYPGQLLQGSDGLLYGECAAGGILHYAYDTGDGVIFRISMDGSSYTNLYQFNRTNGDGYFPNDVSRLVEAPDGAMYGTTMRGGAFSGGTIFKINKDGTAYSTIYSFSATNTDGSAPIGALLLSGSYLYGYTGADSTGTNGTIFKISTDGLDYQLLHNFSSNFNDGVGPNDHVVFGNDGFLYGTTYYGGKASAGCIFKIDTNGNSFSLVRSFNPTGGDGITSVIRLTDGKDGTIFGTTRTGGNGTNGTMFRIDYGTSNYSVIHSFDGPEGITPIGPVLCTTNNKLFAVTSRGGTGGYGTIIQCNRDGTELTTVHNFTGSTNDARVPAGGLIVATDGYLYGLAMNGGANNEGVIYRVSPDGSEYTNVYDFAGGITGSGPLGELIQASDGSFYGTCTSGNVFKWNPLSGYAKLYQFGYEYTPAGTLLEGSDGRLYGVTPVNQFGYYPTIFAIQKNGLGFSTVKSFSNPGTDGTDPNSPLIELSNGRLYGTTLQGGPNSNDGVHYGMMFSLQMTGVSFSNYSQFVWPTAGLNLMSDGALWAPFDANSSGLYRITFLMDAPPSSSIISNAGSTVSLSTIAYGLPSACQWSKNGTLLPNITNSTLVLTNVQSADAGTYTTTLSNGYGSGTTTFILNVRVPPVFTRNPTSQTVLGGATVTFSAAATGTPTYVWRKNGQQIPDANSSTLILSNVVRTNSGTYSVFAVNLAGGAVSSNATLSVHVPQLLSVPQMQLDGSVILSAVDSNFSTFASNADTSAFQAQFSSNLVDWLPLAVPIVVTNGTLRLQDGNADPQRFYRIIETW